MEVCLRVDDHTHTTAAALRTRYESVADRVEAILMSKELAEGIKKEWPRGIFNPTGVILLGVTPATVEEIVPMVANAFREQRGRDAVVPPAHLGPPAVGIRQTDGCCCCCCCCCCVMV